MCLLTYYPTDVQPDCEALWNGSLTNRDGHGFAIATRGGLIVRKGMSANKMIKMFESMRARHPDGPALFHSRFGTGGSLSTYNVHPFRFRGDRRTVVGHNGILPAATWPGKKDPRCDTRIAADQFLPEGFGHLSNPVNRALVGEWIGKSNKLVILSVNPDYGSAPVSYIINESSGVWDDTGFGNTWYSNTGYEDWYSSYKGKSSTWWDDAEPDPADEMPDKCPVCDSAEIGKYGKCYLCESCVLCSGDWNDCLCYNSVAESREREAQKEEEDSPAWMEYLNKRLLDARKQIES